MFVSIVLKTFRNVKFNGISKYNP